MGHVPTYIEHPMVLHPSVNGPFWPLFQAGLRKAEEREALLAAEAEAVRRELRASDGLNHDLTGEATVLRSDLALAEQTKHALASEQESLRGEVRGANEPYPLRRCRSVKLSP